MGPIISTIAVLMLVAAGVFFAIRSLRKSRKAGRCCGCSGGSCAGCTKCRDFEREFEQAQKPNRLA